MHDIAAREAVTHDLWQSIPLDTILCGLFIFVAAGLQLAGLLP